MKLMNLTQIKSWIHEGMQVGAHTSNHIDLSNCEYNQKKNDPFIIDSVGWGYYLIGDFINAEIFLRKAIQLMPNDPIVNDHYGDILWKLNRKIQAKYYWKSAMESEESENDMKKNGGLITRADLKNYDPVWRLPLISDYRGNKVITMGPPSSGGVHIIQMLNILENYNLKEFKHNSSKYINLLTEVMKHAYADRSIRMCTYM